MKQEAQRHSGTVMGKAFVIALAIAVASLIGFAVFVIQL
jgi:hypothetical protein